MTNHLVQHIKNPNLKSDNTLHVIGVITNPVRYQSRYRLFHQWAKEMLSAANVKLYVCEGIYGDRQAECAPENKEYEYHSVKINSEIWIKENLINIAVKAMLPKDWKYMAWIDCDVHFHNPNWALATLQQLQHYTILQPWGDAIDLDFYGGVHQAFKSFGSFCAKGKPMAHHGKDPYAPYGHSGFAWACTRYFYENVQKLADFNPVGAGDHAMAWGCMDQIEKTMPSTISKDYQDTCSRWANKASFACAKLVGFVPGTITHHFHGPKAMRNYWNRWDILTSNDFEPSRDLSYDSQGVMQLCGANKYKIEQGIMLYNRQRMEDSIEQY